jgi:hypothetical protein
MCLDHEITKKKSQANPKVEQIQSYESNKSIHRIITFSSNVENSSKQERLASQDNFDDFDEHSNVSDKLQIYDCEMIGDEFDELRASKDKMNIHSVQRNLVSPGTRKIWSAKIRNNPGLHMFFSNDKSLTPLEKIHQKESPEFSKISAKEKIRKVPYKTYREDLPKSSVFSKHNVSLTVRSKEQR